MASLAGHAPTLNGMCGIAGGTGPDDAGRRSVLERQLGTLHRRGPDSWGFHAAGGAMVGQTRLAVIDVQRGDPPLTDESGDVGVALNGEIYNYRLIREQLLAAGHTLVTSGDTEVIAHLAEDLEPVELARRLDGMFAFAVWDGRRRRLVLGRDRLGKKPLYYWFGGGQLVFGSEIKALLADPRVPRELDETVLPDYLAYGYAPSPRTFYRGIRSVPPATVLVLDEGGAPRLERYWDVAPPRDGGFLQAGEQELARELRRLLDAAVRKRLVADVPLGAFLSGGVDSSAVVGLMSAHSTTPVSTFCIGFDEEAYDERRWARLVAERFGTDHHEEVARPRASDLLDDILTACDQPFADSSAIPTWLLSRMTREHVTVALSGDGGDEVFAGYDRFLAGAALGRVPAAVRAPLARAGAGLGGADQRGRLSRAGRLLRAAADPMPQAYLRWVRLFEPELLATLVRSGDRTRHLYDGIWADSAGAPTLARLLDLNRRTYLVDDLLVKADRMSMAHGLEVRSPFLDSELVEFGVRLPPRQQVRGRTTKRLLKTALRDLLPHEVLDRPKKGFGVPLDAWFRGELREETRSRLLSPHARVAQHLDPAGVARLVAAHEAGVQANGQRLWALLALERFLEREGW